MKALRWILFSLVAFAIGTGAALALRPPAVGIPSTTAGKLSGDLSAIAQYASQGRCTAVNQRLNGAQSRIDKLPSKTSESLVRQLQRSLDGVRSSAQAKCQAVVAAKDKADAAEQAKQEQLDATTPEPVTPTSPDPGAADGGPDPGSSEGTTPNGGDGGDGGGTAVPGQQSDGTGEGDDGTNGGATGGGATVSPGSLQQRGEQPRQNLGSLGDLVRNGQR